MLNRLSLKEVSIFFQVLLFLILGGCQLQPADNLKKGIDKKGEIVTSAIYVQAAKGSFNHQAVSRLYQYERKGDVDFLFSGTPLNTFENAWKHQGQAFVALRNDLVPGHLIKATVDALKEYRVVSVTAGVSQPIQMCLLRTRQAVDQNLPLITIASHPAALAQIGKWKSGKQLKEIEVPKGTSEAARLLAEGIYSADSGAIGPCMLEDLYKNLVVVESGIQDREGNTTLFGRLQVEKRDRPVTEDQARIDLNQIIEQARVLARWSN